MAANYRCSIPPCTTHQHPGTTTVHTSLRWFLSHPASIGKRVLLLGDNQVGAIEENGSFKDGTGGERAIAVMVSCGATDIDTPSPDGHASDATIRSDHGAARLAYKSGAKPIMMFSSRRTDCQMWKLSPATEQKRYTDRKTERHSRRTRVAQVHEPTIRDRSRPVQ